MSVNLELNNLLLISIFLIGFITGGTLAVIVQSLTENKRKYYDN